MTDEVKNAILSEKLKKRSKTAIIAIILLNLIITIVMVMHGMEKWTDSEFKLMCLIIGVLSLPVTLITVSFLKILTDFVINKNSTEKDS